MRFKNREDAATLLGARLTDYRGRHPLVLGVPRGAVPMARIIADMLDGDLDVVLVKKLRAPQQPELAIGAVDEAGAILKGRFYAVGQFFEDFSEVTDEMVVATLAHRREPLAAQETL